MVRGQSRARRSLSAAHRQARPSDATTSTRSDAGSRPHPTRQSCRRDTTPLEATLTAATTTEETR
jgi:hypothetical protein